MNGEGQEEEEEDEEARTPSRKQRRDMEAIGWMMRRRGGQEPESFLQKLQFASSGKTGSPRICFDSNLNLVFWM